MNKNTSYKKALIASVLANVILVGCVLFIGIRTSFIQRQLSKIGLYEFDKKERPDYWCLAGWTNTLQKLNYDADVCFFGNSITAGSDFQSYFTDVKICNLGYPGDTVEGLTYRSEQVSYVHPEKIFLMAGINGLAAQTETEFYQAYAHLVKKVKTENPEAEIYLQSILPVNSEMKPDLGDIRSKIKRFNTQIQAISKELGCTYVNLYELYAQDDVMPKELTKDGLHLFPESYKRWAEAIKDYIYR